MKDKELKSIGKWLNTQGYNLNLSDGFWMEEWILGEHTFRDIAELLQDYHTEHLITVAVIKQYNEADLVSFGAYLLSEERQSRISEVNKNNVTDADIANWKAEIKQGKQYTEADMDDAYDKGFKDGNQRDLTGSLIEVINK
jgi:hypothetical protein